MLFFPFLVAGVPWLFFLLIGKRMTGAQFMSTITVIWALFALSQFMVTSSGNRTKESEVVFRPEGCDYSVVFRAEPRYYTTQKATADGELFPLHGAELIVSRGRGLVRAECVSIDYDVESVVQDSATTAMREIALDLGLSRPDYAFETTHLGRIATLSGVKDTEQGRVMVRVVNYHGPRSIMTQYVSSLSSDFQTPEMAGFLRSIKRD